MEKILLKTASILYTLHGKFPKLKFLLDWSCRILPYHEHPEEKYVEGISKLTIQFRTITTLIDGMEHHILLASDGTWNSEFFKENTKLLPRTFLLGIEDEKKNKKRNYVIGLDINGTYYCNASNFGGPIDGIEIFFKEKV